TITAASGVPGTSSRTSSICFAARSELNQLTPVTLASGRLRLPMRPALTGSPPVVKTMGIVEVNSLATNPELFPPVAAMTATRRAINRLPVFATAPFDCPQTGIQSQRCDLRQSRLRLSLGETSPLG